MAQLEPKHVAIISELEHYAPRAMANKAIAIEALLAVLRGKKLEDVAVDLVDLEWRTGSVLDFANVIEDVQALLDEEIAKAEPHALRRVKLAPGHARPIKKVDGFKHIGCGVFRQKR